MTICRAKTTHVARSLPIPENGDRLLKLWLFPPFHRRRTTGIFARGTPVSTQSPWGKIRIVTARNSPIQTDLDFVICRVSGRRRCKVREFFGRR